MSIGMNYSSSSASSSTSSPPQMSSSLAEDQMSENGVATKIEDLGDEDMLKNVPPLHSPTEAGEPSKRGRGRPRKHPLPPFGAVQKVTKGRSKTGCITCRRRKKKCDETKPECNNCIKNAVVCEGYPEKTYWQSGRQRAEGECRSTLQLWFSELPCLIDGIETRIDRVLLDHFVRNVSRILTLFNDNTNPFQEMLLPLALQNRGLMHSLLCLSGSHLSNTDPTYSMAQHHHFGMAMQFLRNDPVLTGQIAIAGDPTIATTLILCLNSICKGDTEGEYRPHLDAARHMLSSATSAEGRSNTFSNFLYEFFMYHDVINSVTTLDRRPILLMENYTLPAFIIQPEAGALLGVLDGLFGYLSKITLLRDQIRTRKANGEHPSVDYEVLSQAVAIDSEIREWVPAQVPESHRYIAAQLYRQSTWVYLYRTIMPSTANPKIQLAVEEGLQYLRHLPENSGTQSILLMPLFILGCAAFDPSQRPEISRRFQGLHEYSRLGNIVTAHEVVKKIWELMDQKDEEKSWDWEKIIKEMGYDFLVT
ncbi:fungal-specific transcription factor domain-domain-containing protein [Tuber borchii]|uniref:Fungal-specific transcription factor domain-domain-containing protein n=1 Tax=Tuber borchii TaxID=42251 RepID=A0A2T6ZB26_TUBBO|nr:fungal-specific transcription factor domain-domain-containing protein [Tuber borchii]